MAAPNAAARRGLMGIDGGSGTAPWALRLNDTSEKRT